MPPATPILEETNTVHTWKSHWTLQKSPRRQGSFEWHIGPVGDEKVILWRGTVQIAKLRYNNGGYHMKKQHS